MKKVRLGIVGAGNMGTNHINNIVNGLCPEIKITAVSERRESRREWINSLLPDVKFFDGSKELIHSGLCDAVLICSPHYSHPEIAISAFKAGLHVMAEKPAGVYTLQVREMIAEADRHPDLVFGIMYNQRTNCIYRKLKSMLTNGELGEVKRVSWIITDWYRTQHYYDDSTWRSTWADNGGGVLLNQSPHQIDLLQWLCGVPVKIHAYCHFGKWHDFEVEDDVTAYLEFENGSTGVFITSTGDAPGTNRLEITGTKGKVVCEDQKIVFSRLTVDEREWCRTCLQGFEAPPCDTFEVETDGKNEQHSAVLNAFAGAILRGEPLVADGREGLNGLLISNAMYLSTWLGRDVTLPFDEVLFRDMLFERCKKPS